MTNVKIVLSLNMMFKSTYIRNPVVAGRFYPGTAESLSDFISQVMAEASSLEKGERVRALVVPHAGYSFSGAVAGKAYGLLKSENNSYDRVLLLAPSHAFPTDKISLDTSSAWQTPLGKTEVDEEMCQKLSDSSDLFTRNAKAHSSEHSLEVQLPFLQTVLPEARLVPAACGRQRTEAIKQSAELLYNLLWEPSTLWLISTDFTHYGDSFGYRPFTHNIADNLRELDLEAVNHLNNKDPGGFLEYLNRTEATICGRVPLLLLLSALQRGAPNIESRLLEYSTSGAITGDYEHCVSYASMAFTEKA